jgi:hypothetical protein
MQNQDIQVSHIVFAVRILLLYVEFPQVLDKFQSGETGDKSFHNSFHSKQITI